MESIVRKVKRAPRYAHNVPNSSGAMKSGSYQLGRMTDSPVAVTECEGEAAENCRTSAIMSMEEEDILRRVTCAWVLGSRHRRVGNHEKQR